MIVEHPRQLIPRAAGPTFHCANRAAAHCRGFIVGEPGYRERQRLPMLGSQAVHRIPNVEQMDVLLLRGGNPQQVGVPAIIVFNLATTFAVLRIEFISQNGVKPGYHIRTGLEAVGVAQCLDQCFLHKIVTTFGRPAEADRISSQFWNCLEEIVPEGGDRRAGHGRRLNGLHGTPDMDQPKAGASRDWELWHDYFWRVHLRERVPAPK